MSSSSTRKKLKLDSIDDSEISELESGPSAKAKLLINESAWSSVSLFLSNEIIEKICSYTNMVSKNLNVDLKLDVNLFKKFIGLLLARKVFNYTDIPIKYLWSEKFCDDIFKETIPYKTFLSILKCLSFDDKKTRVKRIDGENGNKGDRFAAVSEIWYDVVDEFKKYYEPHDYVKIEEQLFQSMARCPFANVVTSQPIKFGIKYWLYVDSKSKFILSAIPSLGENDIRPTGLFKNEKVISLKDKYLKNPKKIAYYMEYFRKDSFEGSKLERELKSLTTKIHSEKWKIHCFNNLIDIVFFNSYILYKETINDEINRLEYSKLLISELIDNENLKKSSLLRSKLVKDYKLNEDCENKKIENFCIGCEMPIMESCPFVACDSCFENGIR